MKTVKRSVKVEQMAKQSESDENVYKVVCTINTTYPKLGERLYENTINDLIRRGYNVTITY